MYLRVDSIVRPAESRCSGPSKVARIYCRIQAEGLKWLKKLAVVLACAAFIVSPVAAAQFTLLDDQIHIANKMAADANSLANAANAQAALPGTGPGSLVGPVLNAASKMDQAAIAATTLVESLNGAAQQEMDKVTALQAEVIAKDKEKENINDDKTLNNTQKKSKIKKLNEDIAKLNEQIGEASKLAAARSKQAEDFGKSANNFTKRAIAWRAGAEVLSKAAKEGITKTKPGNPPEPGEAGGAAPKGGQGGGAAKVGGQGGAEAAAIAAAIAALAAVIGSDNSGPPVPVSP